jgi:hypothetical protein
MIYLISPEGFGKLAVGESPRNAALINILSSGRSVGSSVTPFRASRFFGIKTGGFRLRLISVMPPAPFERVKDEGERL